MGGRRRRALRSHANRVIQDGDAVALCARRGTLLSTAAGRRGAGEWAHGGGWCERRCLRTTLLVVAVLHSPPIGDGCGPLARARGPQPPGGVRHDKVPSGGASARSCPHLFHVYAAATAPPHAHAPVGGECRLLPLLFKRLFRMGFRPRLGTGSTPVYTWHSTSLDGGALAHSIPQSQKLCLRMAFTPCEAGVDPP